MKNPFLLLLLGCLSAFPLASLANGPSSVVEFHQASAESRHCCWDNGYNGAGQQGAGDYDVSSWNATGHAAGIASHGLLSGSVSGSAQRFDSWGASSGSGRVRDYFVDTFSITSPSLAFGTPVLVQLGVTLQFTTFSEMTPNAGLNSQAIAAWHFNGPDAPWIAGVTFDRAYESQDAFSATRSAQATFASWVGASFTLVGDMLLHTVAFATNNPSSARSSLSADAFYTVEVITPNAGFSSVSGAAYVAAVPEPSSMLMFGVGLVVLMRSASSGLGRSKRSLSLGL
jgi:hypothetical protein